MKSAVLEDSDVKYTLEVNIDTNSTNNLTNYSITNKCEFIGEKDVSNDYSIHTIIPVVGLEDELIKLQEFFNGLYRSGTSELLVDIDMLLVTPFTSKMSTRVFECYDKEFLGSSKLTPLAKFFGIILYHDSEVIPKEDYSTLNKFAEGYKSSLRGILAREDCSTFHFENASNIYLNYFFTINEWPLTPDAVEGLEEIKKSHLELSINNGELMKIEGLIVNIFSFVLTQKNDDLTFNKHSHSIIGGDLLITRQEESGGPYPWIVKVSNTINIQSSMELHKDFLQYCNNLFNLKVTNEEVIEAIGNLTLTELVKFTQCLVLELNSVMEVKNYISEYASKHSMEHQNSFNAYTVISVKFLNVMGRIDHEHLHSELFKRIVHNKTLQFIEELVNGEGFSVTRKNYLKLVELFFSDVTEKWCSNSYQMGLILSELTSVMSAYRVFQVLSIAAGEDSPVVNYTIDYNFWKRYSDSYEGGGYDSMPIEWTLQFHAK